MEKALTVGRPVADYSPIEHGCLNADVDQALLNLEPSCLEPYVDGRNGGCATAEFEESARYLTHVLGRRLPEEHQALVAVAANYGALSLRHRYPQDPVACAYPLFLLAAWIWDDIVDTNKGVNGLDVVIDRGWRAIASATTSLDITHWDTQFPSEVKAANPDPVLWHQIEICTRLMRQAHGLWATLAHGYEPAIEAEVVRFFRSFANKVKLTHRAASSAEHFIETRAVCVGMQPCYEMSFAFKARAAGIPARELGQFTATAQAAQCARIATLHCAAVNDLFSMHKDRELEDTANFPSLFAKTDDLGGYFDGALLTVQYIRRLYRNFRVQCARLPEHACKRLVIETWQHMMEGNAIFHLTVPRYREGPRLVRDLLDPSLPLAQQRERFMRVFEPQPC